MSSPQRERRVFLLITQCVGMVTASLTVAARIRMKAPRRKPSGVESPLQVHSPATQTRSGNTSGSPIRGAMGRMGRRRRYGTWDAWDMGRMGPGTDR